jgi:uncharacterized protein YjbI with pentapeptide repeats
MRTKNLTPFLLGYKVTSRRPPRPEIAIFVRGAFVLSPSAPLAVPEGLYPLSQGTLSPDLFREEDEERTGELVYPGDFADWKPKADVLLRGACHPPEGKARTSTARFSVGGWSKTVRVSGTRVWTTGAMGETPSEPVAFGRMPLSYAHAFGGPGHPMNPVGKGQTGDELPNVERPADLVTSRRSWPAPTGFGPLSPTWPVRAEKIGKAYGEIYQKTRAPWFAEDFDWAHFNAAPVDQQIEGYLRGDEEMTFQHLYPDVPRWEKRLPGLRVRAFVIDARERFREVKMVLDTLYANLDDARLFLTWRGLDAVEATDLADVRTVLVAPEAMATAPLPEAHYRAILDAYEKDPLGFEAAVPERLRDGWNAIRGDKGAPPGGAPDPISALLGKQLGGLSPEAQASTQAAVAKALGAPVPPGFDLASTLAKAVNDASRTSAPMAPVTGGAPVAPIGALLRRLAANVGVLRAEAAKGTPVPGLDKLEAFLADPKVRKLDPTFRAPGEPPPDEPGPGRDLRGHDLSGRDLRRADLRGADLTGAILAGTQLQGALLTGAILERTVLFEADLSGADLAGANLTLANLTAAKAPGATFRGAVLEKLAAPRAVLAGATFADAKGAGASFAGADLAGVEAKKVHLEQAIFDGANLEDADLTEAILVRSRFLDARAARVKLERARLAGASFAGADLTDAKLAEADAPGSAWERTRVERADLRWCALAGAYLGELAGKGVRLRCADLREARLYRADLTGADLSYANLLLADLSRACLAGALFAGANLYDAKLFETSRDGADFAGANLRRSTLEAW